MFGKQKENVVSVGGEQLPEINPGRIRTLLSYAEEGSKQRQSIDFSSNVPRESTQSVRRDFFSIPKKDSERKKTEGLSEASPFYKAEAMPIKNPEKEGNSHGLNEKGVVSLGEVKSEKPFISNLNEDSDRIVGKKDGIKENISQQPVIRTFSEKAAVLQEVDLTKRPAENVFTPNVKKSNASRVFFVVGVILLFGLTLWGGYFYWESRISSVSQGEISVVVNTPKGPDVEKDSTSSFPYEKKISNSIIVNDSDGKTVVSEIEKAIETTANFQGDGVFEFFFVDGANNFNTILEKDLLQRMGVSLPSRLDSFVNGSGEGRMYIAKNGSDVRVVFAVPVTARDASLAAMLQSEGELLKSMSPVYFSEVSVDSVVPKFSDQTYRGYAIRYFNIDIPKNYSLDYSFRRDIVYLATSKQSLRDVLDFLDGKEKSFNTSSDVSSEGISEKK